MLQQNVSPDGDFIAIRGRSLDFASLVTPAVVRSVDRLSADFAKNDPFPHLVIDGLFSRQLLELIHDEFDQVGWNHWKRYDSADEVKRGSRRGARLGPASQLYFNTIHSYEFVQFVEKLTGIRGLLPDPTLHGGGLHEIPDGGHFRVHIDFNRHPVTQLDNRLVLITYLNEGWRPEFGGALELWNQQKNEKVHDVLPIFGRTIIFQQTPHTLHGHPVPVGAPDRRPRRSVAAYFYSNGGSGIDADPYRTTQFPMPPQSRAESPLMHGLKYITPPVLIDAARSIGARIAAKRSAKRAK
jgi:hypothetical protein